MTAAAPIKGPYSPTEKVTDMATPAHENSDTRILVAAGSKHGGTTEIANRIGDTLRDRGFDTTVAESGQVRSVQGFDVVVLGSAVYAGHWMATAKDMADVVAEAEPMPAVWLFSSGPVGDPPKPDVDPADVVDITRSTGARGHELFAGKLDRSKLNFGERAITAALRAPEGDFRDWAAIDRWAGRIAESRGSESPRAV